MLFEIQWKKLVIIFKFKECGKYQNTICPQQNVGNKLQHLINMYMSLGPRYNNLSNKKTWNNKWNIPFLVALKNFQPFCLLAKELETHGHVIWISKTTSKYFYWERLTCWLLHLHYNSALLFQAMPSLQQCLVIHNISSCIFNITMPYHL